MESESLDTVYLKDKIARCEDIDELKKCIIPLLKSQREQWKEKINQIIEKNKYTKVEFAELCGVSRVSVDKWCKGAIPKNRETFLRIGMAANYDLENMNQLLQRYGQYPGLYAKSLEDCVCIYVLNNYSGKAAMKQYYYILNRIKENIIRDRAEELDDINTEKFSEKLSEIKNEEALESFITDNIAIFASCYHKFYAYVKMFIEINYKKFSSSVNELANGQEWSSSLKQCVSAIRQNKWYPTRNKIISLGLHLSMDHDQIDEMLMLAHMEPLCAKNIFESVIMFILDDASLNNMLDTELEEFEPEELCRYARVILSQMELPEIEEFLSELPEIEEV